MKIVQIVPREELRLYAAPEQEWQLLSAFLGFIGRHLDDEILAITIHYR